MKTMNYSIIRCICALVLGVLLVAWPEAAILYLVITIGALFLVPGLFSVFGYLTRGKQNGMSFPIAGLGSLLFGLWLMIMPAFFVGILMYVLGAVLVLAGISQIVNLSAARSWTVVPGGFFVVPVLVLYCWCCCFVQSVYGCHCAFYYIGGQQYRLWTFGFGEHYSFPPKERYSDSYYRGCDSY